MKWIQLSIIIITGIYIIYKDLKERIIPNEINLFILICGFVVMFYTKQYTSHLLGFVLLGVFMFLLAALTKGFGMGDVKYIFACGLFLGLEWAGYGLLIGVMLGGIGSAVLLMLKKVDKKDFIPYGPYLVLGNIVALFIL